MIKALNPTANIGFIGAKVAVEPRGKPEGLRRRSISSPATNSTSPSRKSPRARDWSTIKGLSYRDAGRRDRP